MEMPAVAAERRGLYPFLERAITLAERWAFAAAIMALGGLIRNSDRFVVGSTNEWALVYIGALVVGFLISLAASVLFVEEVGPKPARKVWSFVLLLGLLAAVLGSNWFVMLTTAKWMDNEHYVKWCPAHPTSDKPACVRYRQQP